MSKKLEVLRLLEDNPQGVSGKVFYERFNGRGVARIYDLRKDGHLIDDKPDPRDPKYKIYILRGVGVESDDTKVSQLGSQGHPGNRGITLDSGVEASVSSSPPPPGEDADGSARPLNPYEAEVWAD